MHPSNLPMVTGRIYFSCHVFQFFYAVGPQYGNQAIPHCKQWNCGDDIREEYSAKPERTNEWNCEHDYNGSKEHCQEINPGSFCCFKNSDWFIAFSSVLQNFFCICRVKMMEGNKLCSEP